MNGRQSPNVGLGLKSSGARFASEARKLVETRARNCFRNIEHRRHSYLYRCLCIYHQI